MTQQARETRTVTIPEAKAQLSPLLEEVSRGETRILILEAGVPVAALVGSEDLKRLERMDAEDREAWTILEAMRAPFRDVPPEEIERKIERARAEIRAERRAEREAAAVKR